MFQSIRLIRFTHLIILIVLIGHLLVIGKELLIPTAFSILLAFLLMPVVEWLERRVGNPALPILFSVILSLIPIALIIWFFSHEITRIIRDLGTIDAELRAGLDQILTATSQITGLPPSEEKHLIEQQFIGFLDRSFGTITSVLASSTTVLAELIMTLILTFFMLLYRRTFKEFILLQFPSDLRPEVTRTMVAVQGISSKYALGLFLLTFVLGILYSLGLWLMGISYAPFWGMLMAVMNIVPYIGNLLGLIFLGLYALASTGDPLILVLILGLHLLIQTLEGNLIRPYLVGSSVNVNALSAIISLVVGGFLWGVAGLILALPFTAMIKVVCDRIDYLKPVGELLGTGISSQGGLLSKYDEERYQLNQLFRRNLPKEKKAPT